MVVALDDWQRALGSDEFVVLGYRARSPVASGRLAAVASKLG
eukprot:CAMPEP_0169302812 /NCGR_PEP_ID=MMETSP1016-20121227/69000_1 /TAXON_ID=342587 /ORGANISM="Karlodinium micrum, Strain CCMP2283" /LENGTH=41 /DNA_ID= /DNA_START= /DNA_END= /DNA_ORIENTATION=